MLVRGAVEAAPGARDTLLDLFTHKWGDPDEERGRQAAVLVFRHDDPRVEVREDTEHGAWLVEIK